MAEVLPAPVEGRLVHSTGANTAPQAGSLWTNSSWFSAPPAPCPNDRPRHELPAPIPQRNTSQVRPCRQVAPAATVVVAVYLFAWHGTQHRCVHMLQAKSVGGAAAQCRFSGRCAVPIATMAPVDGSPVTVSMAAAPRGMTCDGSKAAAPPSLVSGGGLMSAWRFDLQRWAWVPRDGGASPGAQTARHQLAARRHAPACWAWCLGHNIHDVVAWTSPTGSDRIKPGAYLTHLGKLSRPLA